MRVLDEKEIKERKNRMLQSVILEYIRTAKPVSSGSISKQGGVKLSSATVRNLLHSLEMEGFLEHPHTSAGRIPTDRGYRYYVDYLIDLHDHLVQEQDRIHKEYVSRQQQIEELMQQTSRMLAYMSNQAGFVLKPKLDESQLQRLELINLGEERLLVVMVASNGLVRYKILEGVNSSMSGSLKTMARWINTQFQGRNLKEFCMRFEDELEERLEAQKQQMREVLSLLADPIEEFAHNLTDESLHLEGTANVLRSPEMSFQPGYLADVATVFQNREQLTQLIRKEVERHKRSTRKQLSIMIGKESKHPVFEQLALLAKSFETKDHTVGVLGIIGPKRMEYGRMVALVENVHTALQKMISKEIYDGGKEARKRS